MPHAGRSGWHREASPLSSCVGKLGTIRSQLILSEISVTFCHARRPHWGLGSSRSDVLLLGTTVEPPK